MNTLKDLIDPYIELLDRLETEDSLLKLEEIVRGKLIDTELMLMASEDSKELKEINKGFLYVLSLITDKKGK